MPYVSANGRKQCCHNTNYYHLRRSVLWYENKSLFKEYQKSLVWWLHQPSRRQHCRFTICSNFGWVWRILRIWDEQACLRLSKTGTQGHFQCLLQDWASSRSSNAIWWAGGQTIPSQHHPLSCGHMVDRTHPTHTALIHSWVRYARMYVYVKMIKKRLWNDGTKHLKTLRKMRKAQWAEVSALSAGVAVSEGQWCLVLCPAMSPQFETQFKI